MNSVGIVGLGRLGLPLAAVLAETGLTVVGADVNSDVLDSVRRCEPLFYEPRLQELLCAVSDKIALVDDAGVAAFVTDVSIVLVPTPSETDGSFSLKYVLDVCRSIGEALIAMEQYHLVVISSTVMPGACAGEILETLEKASDVPVGERWGLCYIPEWVALGNVIRGFSEPEFVIIGASDDKAYMSALSLYERLCVNDPPIVRMNLTTAEFAKIAANCYFATKITFANQIADLCEQLPGVDVDVLTNAIGMDSRIGRSYLTGATAAGGRCFGRDLEAMHAVAMRMDIQLPLFDGVQEVNVYRNPQLMDLVSRQLDDDDCLGILGLAFKPGTDDMTESFGAMLAEWRWPGYSGSVVTFDPLAKLECSVRSAQECVDQADVVVVTNPCEEFKGLVFREGQTVVDCWRLLDRVTVRAAGAKYVGIGLGEGA